MLTDERKMSLAAMLVLTFSTGIVDAVGYLAFDRVFTANMTGNVIILGMGIAGANGLPVLRPVLALAFFMVGAVIAGRILRPTGKHWAGHTTGVLAVVAAGVLGISLYVALIPPEAITGPAGTVVTSVVSGVMGMQAAAARRLATTDVTTVVVTSTIVGLASESHIAGGSGEKWVRRSLAVVLIGLGAMVGGFSLKINAWLGTLLCSIIIAFVALCGEILRRRIAAREHEEELAQAQ